MSTGRAGGTLPLVGSSLWSYSNLVLLRIVLQPVGSASAREDCGFSMNHQREPDLPPGGTPARCLTLDPGASSLTPCIVDVDRVNQSTAGSRM